MTDTQPLEAYVPEYAERFTGDLLELVVKPSVSATDRGVEDCTELLVSLCTAAGFDDTRIIETDGQPAIRGRAFADHSSASATPAALLYGHYDMQPVTPTSGQRHLSTRRYARDRPVDSTSMRLSLTHKLVRELFQYGLLTVK
jgi:acetylornithine deacetylase/succinyl-diaminopimelate desuccinylase-like protein